MGAPQTRESTLRRLSGLAVIDNVLDAVDIEAIEESDDWGWELLNIGDQPAAWFWAQNRSREAEWCRSARATLGLPVKVLTQSAGGLLVLEVDGTCYALGFGQGFRWIHDECIDQRFGLRVAVRAIDTEHLRSLIRRRPAMRGRTESSLVPSGAPIWWLRPRDYTEIVRRIAGRGKGISVTYAQDSKRNIMLEGSSGLKMRLGVEPVDLISDIRAVAAIAAADLPDPELAFVDNIVPITDQLIVNELDAALETALGDLNANDNDDLAIAIPEAGLDFAPMTTKYRVDLGSGRALQDDITVGDLAQFARRWVPGQRIAALARLNLEMHGSPDGSAPLWKTKALKWLEYSTTLSDKSYFMMESKWYEMAVGYLEHVESLVKNVMSGQPSVELPSWQSGWPEKIYNEQVALSDRRYVRMDRRLIQNELHKGPGLEVCDLLGPSDELIHVKKANGSASLSHLFAQGLVSIDAMASSARVRADFRERVHQFGHGREISVDYEPSRVIFAILMPAGRQLTPESLFPFSKATLAQTAGTLRDRGITVEVMGISLAPER